MRHLVTAVALLHLGVPEVLGAQRVAAWKAVGDTSGAPSGCSAAASIAAITGWFAAFGAADSAGLARVTPPAHAAFGVFSTGKFIPSDTFVRIESLAHLIAYARARQRQHEVLRLQAVRFYGWRGRELGFMPYYLRSADDFGAKPLPGIGKAAYACGRGVLVLNLAPRPTFDRGP